MITTSALYKSILAEKNHSVEWKINVNGVDYGTDKIDANAAGGDARPRLVRKLFTGSDPEVGACVASQLSCSLFEASANIPRMAAVVPSYRLVYGAQASEWIQKGVFYIDTRGTDEALGTTMLHCYDAMLKADGENGKSYADLTGFTTWPQAMSAVAAEIATIIGVQIDARTTFGSGTGYSVEYPNDLTMREVLGYIAAAHGACWTMTDAGKLRMVKITGNNEGVTVNWSLDALDAPPALTAWSGCVVYYGDEEAFSAGDETGLVLTCDCPWATQETADGLLQVISGVRYQPFRAENAVMDLAAELGDSVVLGGTGGTLSGAVTGHIFSIEISCDAGARTTVAAPGEAEIDHEYPYASAVDRSLQRKVTLGQSYYGTSISREKGIEIKRSDGASEAVFNSDTFAMRARIDGTMKDRIYFDPIKGDYVFDGALGADAIFTDSLYAEQGDIAELTVDRLSTSRRIRKYILGDTSDDNYIKIQDQYIRLITGKVNYQISILTESGANILSEGGVPLICEADEEHPAVVQATNRNGQPLYWQREPVGHTSDGYPLDADGVQIYATTDQSEWPVYHYSYIDLVKAAYFFNQQSGTYVPLITMGAGYGNPNDPEAGKGFIQKTTDSFNMWLHTSQGENRGLFIGEDYTDVTKLRKPTKIDLSNWSGGLLYETLDVGNVNGFVVEFDEHDRPVKFIDAVGHETEVVWDEL